MRIEIARAQGYGYVAKPVSQQTNKLIEAYLASHGEAWDGVYFQELENLKDNLDKPHRKRVDNELAYGWPIVITIDDWVFLQGWVGYDAGDNGLRPLP